MPDDDLTLKQKTQNLHARILDGDVTANSELAVLTLPRLTNRLRKRYPDIYDPNLIDTAVTDALLKYFSQPDHYQSQKSSLLGYLLMSANGDLLNYLKSRKIDQNSNPLAEDVELWDSFAEESIEASVVIDESDVEEEVLQRLSPVDSKLRELFSDPKDQELAIMLINGVRETGEYAKVLEIGQMSLSEQQKAVKRHKDRIKKVIIRHIDPKELKDDK